MIFDSRRSFLDDFWSTRGCLMLLTRWGYFDSFDPLGNNFDAFDPLGMLLIYWGYFCHF